MTSPSAALAELKRGAVDLISEPELLARLGGDRPLRVKAGFDPTRPDLHFGHVVLLNKLRQFQDLGHTVVFIVGDFTAQVGDPTGRNKARPPLSREDVVAGAKTYAEQAFKVLSRERLEIRYNSEWLDALSPQDFVRLCAKRTVERTMERRDFRERFEKHEPIHLHEFLYPLLQAYDSVAIDADVELGGTDQLFNLNVGRDLMTAYGKREQMVMTTPLLEGLDARMVDGRIVGEKMSKSADNYVGVTEAPVEMFKKLMLVNDGVILRYFELLSSRTREQVDALKSAAARGELAAREAQRRFAREMVERFHDADAARDAEAQYDLKAAGGFPADAIAFCPGGSVTLTETLKQTGLASSGGDARRTIVSGSIAIDGARVTDPSYRFPENEKHQLVKGGKHKQYVFVDTTPAVAGSKDEQT